MRSVSSAWRPAVLPIGLAAALITGLTAAPAQAQSSTVLTLPGHPADTGLTLIGASTRGVVVRQGAITGVSDSPAGATNMIFSGAEGGELTRREPLEPSLGGDHPTVLGVTGGTLAWYDPIPGAGVHNTVVHRMNLRTGVDVADGEMAAPTAFTGANWLSENMAFLSPPIPPPVLARYPVPAHPGTGMLSSTPIATLPYNPSKFAADSTRALRASFALSDPTNGDSTRIYRLDLIDLTTGSSTTLLQNSPDEITGVALSSDTLAWAEQTPAGLRISTRSRAGGAVSTYTGPDSAADGDVLAAGHGRAGYLVTTVDGTLLRIVTGTSARNVTVPTESSGLAAVGDRFLTAVGGGTAAETGVYSVDAGSGQVRRTATVPVRTYPIDGLAFSDGRLHYTDEARTDAPGQPVWSRTVSGSRHLTLSGETLLSTRTAGAIAFSAGRGAVTTPLDPSAELLDRTTVSGGAAGGGQPNVSGPYTLFGQKVFRPDGELLYTEPDLGQAGADDLFGSRVIYSRLGAADGGGDQKATIWLADAETPGRAPVLLATEPAASCRQAPPVSIWGDTVAWASCTDDTISVRDLAGRSTRTVPTGVAAGDSLRAVVLGEGTLAWISGWTSGTTHLLDLGRAHSRPVTLPGATATVLLDDHRVARQLMTPGGPDAADVQPLPFGGRYAPRLLGTLAPLGFTPDGDGHRDTWEPEFDVTKPLRSAQLKITTIPGGTLVRSLTTTAPDGSIRGLSWDGRDAHGAVAPIGLYRWTLTGQADDGEGALIAADGSATVTGTVEIDAVHS